MNLVRFLLIGAISLFSFGLLSRFPFFSLTFGIYFSEVLLVLSGLFFLIWQLTQRSAVFIPAVFRLMLAFLLIALVSLIYSIKIFGLNEILIGSSYLVRFILYCFSFLIVFNLVKRNSLKIESLVNLWIKVGITVAIFGFIQLLFFPNFEFLTEFGFDPHHNRLSSTLLDPNFTGAFLVLTLSLVVSKILSFPGKKVWLVIAAFLLTSIFLTLSRSALLMLGLFVIIFGFLKNRSLIVLFLTAVLVLSLIYPRFQQRLIGGLLVDETAKIRIENWQSGWQIFKSSPIIGIGFNNLRIAQTELNSFSTTSAEGGRAGSSLDSSWLQVLSTTGMLGLVVFLLFWFKTLNLLRQKGDNLSLTTLCVLLSLFIDAQFIDSLFFPVIMLWYFTTLGGLLAEVNSNEAGK